ncbi:CoA transferase [Pseudooceanicola sediminis]|uniref:CoA transferase n=1 Tax=Pseudooceanicola sediminis TaxID=2211117 RepID=A0A399IVP0_9RHOB|nr:CaiB/BaiF CoA-transferase family protein [Pseudooceanicola sediminis]KAA2312674.1 CoA transferase [Puniceibacterium sp. HSS470]RII37111.1 CoA transferase [Pseudooceanicola sediminis]
MSGPLSHVRVLDLSRIMAGPWSGQILADLGAEVLKIERAGVGDDTRRWGPPFMTGIDGEPTQESGYYLSVNRGKKSIEVDIASPEGQEMIRDLARECDIVLENFKVGTLKRYGLDEASLRAINPRLIYCSITGFGQDGPMAQDAAYDFMIQAMGGLLSVTGAPDGAPGAGPQKVGVPVIDIMTGMYATVAVLAALARRSETGRGDTIDLAMLDVATAMLANQAMNHLVSGQTPTRTGNKHPNIQPQDIFPVRDGHIVIAVGNDAQFQRFASTIGHPDWSTDPRFATNAARVENLDTLHSMICETLMTRDLAEWRAALVAVNVPCAPINTVPGVLAEPQVQHRQMLRHLPHPLSGTVPQVISPMRFAEAPLRFDRPPPLLGQHTDEIRQRLAARTEQD